MKGILICPHSYCDGFVQEGKKKKKTQNLGKQDRQFEVDGERHKKK